MFFGMVCTPSVIQAAHLPFSGAQRRTGRTRRACEDNSRDAARKRSLEDIESPANVRFDKGTSRVRRHMRFVQRRRMNDEIDPSHTTANEVGIGNRTHVGCKG